MGVYSASGGFPGLVWDLIELRVPPVPRFWGPGRSCRSAGIASTREVASLGASAPLRINLHVSAYARPILMAQSNSLQYIFKELHGCDPRQAGPTTITAEGEEVSRLLITDALAFHTLREYSSRRGFGSVALPSPVPKSEGPGAPSAWLGNPTGTEATRLGKSEGWRTPIQWRSKDGPVKLKNSPMLSHLSRKSGMDRRDAGWDDQCIHRSLRPSTGADCLRASMGPGPDRSKAFRCSD